MKNNKGFKIAFFPLVALSALLCAIDGFLGLSVLITGVLVSWYTARFGLTYSLWSLPLLFVVGFWMGGTFLACFLCAQAISTFAIGAFIHKQGTFSGMMIAATGIETAVLAIFTRAISNALSKEPAEFLFGDSMKTFSDSLLQSGQFENTAITEMQNMMRMVFDMLQSMLPFFYLVAALVFVYVIFAITRFCLEKQDFKISQMPKFCEFWLLRSISNIFVILFLLSLFINSPILTNVVSFMFFIHVVCGISVVDFYMKKRGMASGIRALLLVSIITISTVIGGLGTSILCCIGMTDKARSAGR